MHRALEYLANELPSVGNLVEPEEGVYFGERFGKVGGKALRHTAGDHQALARAFLHAPLFVGIEDGLDGFLLGGIDERAGVDDEYVGVVGICREPEAFFLEAAEHDFGIHKIFGAAEADHSDFGWSNGFHQKI